MRNTTRNELSELLKQLTTLTGKNHALTYAAAYGGYRIETEDGATPYGAKRRSGKQLREMLQFAVDVCTTVNRQ